MKRSLSSVSAAALGFAMLAACAGNSADNVPPAEVPVPPPAADAGPTVEDARAFLERADAELAAMSKEISPIFWEQATNITDETNAAAAAAGAKATKLSVSLANETKKFNDVDLPADLDRKMKRLHNGPGRHLRHWHLRLQGRDAQSRSVVDDHRDEPRPGRTKSGLGRLAHDFTADEGRLCTHGRNRQCRCARTWL